MWRGDGGLRFHVEDGGHPGMGDTIAAVRATPASQVRRLLQATA